MTHPISKLVDFSSYFSCFYSLTNLQSCLPIPSEYTSPCYYADTASLLIKEAALTPYPHKFSKSSLYLTYLVTQTITDMACLPGPADQSEIGLNKYISKYVFQRVLESCYDLVRKIYGSIITKAFDDAPHYLATATQAIVGLNSQYNRNELKVDMLIDNRDIDSLKKLIDSGFFDNEFHSSSLVDRMIKLKNKELNGMLLDRGILGR